MKNRDRDEDWARAAGASDAHDKALMVRIAQGDEAALRELIEKHAYDANVLIQKTNAGPGGGNQSDDEMIFMCFYNLLKYETDP